MPEELFMIELNLEESGWLCHALMRELEPYINGRERLASDLEKRGFVRKMTLYEKLTRANDVLMGKVPDDR